MNSIIRFKSCLWLIGLLITLPVYASNFDYQLTPKLIAKDTYLFEGKREDFNFDNGGNIVNTAFVVTDKGVIVIDSGPSRRYGEQMLAAIRSVTNQSILRVINTHHHPDHFLGNQVFDASHLFALANTRSALLRDADSFTDNSYRMTGNWMKGTEPKLPKQTIEPGTFDAGNHRIRFIQMSGHTESDLVIFDETTGVLFAGDLVFYQRAATTPHAQLDAWQDALNKLEKIPFKVLVPGHGPVTNDTKPIEQTRDYLSWLSTTLTESAASGLDMIETMQQPIPKRFAEIDLVGTEFIRSVSHLFPALEKQVLKPTKQAR